MKIALQGILEALMVDHKKLAAYLSSFLSDERQKKIKKNIFERTRYVTVILEDLYNSHNTAAVLRSCDALGVQDVHCIESQHRLDVKKNISMGSSKWLTLHRYRSEQVGSAVQECVTKLKEQGYFIVATSPHATTALHDLPLNQKIAFMFGTEDEGLSDQAFALADTAISIPMFGFVESFNVSVSVALCLYDVMTRLRSSTLDWRLSEEEQEALELIWLKKAISRGDIHEKTFYKNNE